MNFSQIMLHRPGLRWTSSFIFVGVAFSGAILFVTAGMLETPALQTQPMAAMMIELAPVPAAPPLPTDTADHHQTEVLSAQTPPVKPTVTAQTEIEPTPELPIINDADAILPNNTQDELKPELIVKKDLIQEEDPISEEKPIEKEEPILKEETVVKEKSPQQEMHSPSKTAPPSDIVAAPTQGAVSLFESQEAESWQSMLLGHLEKHKRYPRQARRRGQEAIVYVNVKIDRDGSVLEHHLTQTSQHRSLNREALALIARAEPLPPPPMTVAGLTIEFVVPVAFSLRR
ncbi:MAG: energy transducer TonB [Pseudomonadales bacterium]|nr:energy transducer TonB [Pseudomonadales bacterium]